MIKRPNKFTIEAISNRLTTWVGSPQSLIAHTAFFIAVFILPFTGVPLDQVLLILTTLVSLEAIYLALFIQMTVNKNTESLEDVEEGLDDIQEDVQGLEKDVEEIQTDVESLEENVEDISEDLEEPATHPSTRTESLHTLTQIEQQLSDITKSLSHLRSEIETLKKE